MNNWIPADQVASVAKSVRRHLVRMTAESKSSHIGSCFSIVDALTVLYFRTLKNDPTQPLLSTRDRFILSKAHGSAALYAVLAERGYFDVGVLRKFYIDNGILPGHLDSLAVPGVETSGGSLGHGLALGIGMALSNLRKKSQARVFVLVGDGECNEGSIWEGAMLAPKLGLSNLTVLIDYNKIQGFGATDEILDQRNMVDRWAAFGWQATELDGHDYNALERALADNPVGRPKALILHTVKGKGVSFMEGQLAWHYRSPGPKEVELALKELE